MKMIYVDLWSSSPFRPIIVDAEQLGIMWKINSYEVSHAPSRTKPERLIPYSDEIWENMMDMKQTYADLWKKRLELKKLTVAENIELQTCSDTATEGEK